MEWFVKEGYTLYNKKPPVKLKAQTSLEVLDRHQVSINVYLVTHRHKKILVKKFYNVEEADRFVETYSIEDMLRMTFYAS